MKPVKILGGILALVSGTFLLIITLKNTGVYWGYGDSYIGTWVFNFIISALALGGGLLGLAGKNSGGGLAFMVGLISIAFGLIFWYSSIVIFLQYSFLTEIWHLGIVGNNLFLGISLEAILITIGGLCVLVGGLE